MLMLLGGGGGGGKPMQQVDMASRLRVSNRSEVLKVLKDLVARKLVAKTEPENRLSPYELTESSKRTYFDLDFAEIGSAQEIEAVTRKIFDTYLKKGMFVTLASQRIRKGQDRTDLVAYDYYNETPISVEIESAAEVQSHPEHVRYNMTKWPRLGFEQCHVWSRSPKIHKIFETLEERERQGVTALVI